MPYAVEGPPWKVIEGNEKYTAVVSDTPGSEGADRPIAELAAGETEKPVYALWLDPEREQIFVWQRGLAGAMQPGAPLELARQLGFDTAGREPDRPPFDVAVVEGATLEEVRQALGDTALEPWLRIEPCAEGVLLSSEDGTLGTQGWDAAEALPQRTTTYLVQRWPGTGAFSVVVLRGGVEVGRFRVPEIEDDALLGIKGAQTPEGIAAALGIPPQLLGFNDK